MLLVVDVGNSSTSIGVFGDPVDRAELVCELRLGTHRNWTRDELGMVLQQALGLRGIVPPSIHAAALACSVPPIQAAFVAAVEMHIGVRPLVVGPGVKTGMSVRYDPPQDVGADRIVCAIAAHETYGRTSAGPRPVVVVDFGTATTFDVVSAKPEYLGGAIAPGVGISADALFERAAKLPRVEIARPPQVIGRNTVNAVQSGLFHGFVALVEGMIARIREELLHSGHDQPPAVVATGQHAAAIAAETRAIDVVDDTLMLRGLWAIHARNRS